MIEQLYAFPLYILSSLIFFVFYYTSIVVLSTLGVNIVKS